MDGETMVLGTWVDSVQEVLDLVPDSIEPAPRFGTRHKMEFIKGMGKQDGRLISILDIVKVFFAENLVLVQGTQAEAGRNTAGKEANKNKT